MVVLSAVCRACGNTLFFLRTGKQQLQPGTSCSYQRAILRDQRALRAMISLSLEYLLWIPCCVFSLFGSDEWRQRQLNKKIPQRELPALTHPHIRRSSADDGHAMLSILDTDALAMHSSSAMSMFRGRLFGRGTTPAVLSVRFSVFGSRSVASSENNYYRSIHNLHNLYIRGCFHLRLPL